MAECLSPPKSPYEEVAHEYFSYNPALFDDPSIPYRQLQKLSMKLGLGGAGKRVAIQERLQQWHRRYLIRDKQSPMKNFALVEIDVGKAGKKNRAVSPRLLSPLKKKPSKRRADGTPISILSPSKGKVMPEAKSTNCASRAYAAWLEKAKLAESEAVDKENQAPNASEAKENADVKQSNKKKRRISFSCINGVKLIPVRPPTPEICYWRQENLPTQEEEEEEEEQSPRECNEYFESDDHDSSDDEGEEEESGVKNLNNSFDGAGSPSQEGSSEEREAARKEEAKQRKKRRCSLDQLRAPSRPNTSAIDLDEEMDGQTYEYDDDEEEEASEEERARTPKSSPASSISISLSPGAVAMAAAAGTVLASVLSIMS